MGRSAPSAGRWVFWKSRSVRRLQEVAPARRAINRNRSTYVQTAFTPEQLGHAEIAEADGILKTCVHYGFCTATCPTYVLFRDENDSPRGRIDLIRAMLEKGGAPDAKTVHHLDRCLSCLSCVTTCAVKVDYAHLIDIARTYIEKNYRRPLGERILRRMIAELLPYPMRFALALRLARAGRPVAGLLPDVCAISSRSLPDGPPLAKFFRPEPIRPTAFAKCGWRCCRVAPNRRSIETSTRRRCGFYNVTVARS